MSAAGNFAGKGDSPEAKLRRRLSAQKINPPGPVVGNGGSCPDCGIGRATAETLRVHRWLAHGIRASA